MATVLLVDDDVDLVDAYRIVLEARGHTVVSAGSAGEARELLADRRPDAVVSDVMMETPTAGMELVRWIQQRHAGLPVLMLSGVHEKTGSPFRFEPDETWLPVLKFLDKPVAPKALAEEVDRAVDTSDTDEDE
jgi:DNA-binding NtrC family response regulator